MSWHGRSPLAASRRRKPSLESLEARQILDAAGLFLNADAYSTHQNGTVIALDVLKNDGFATEYAGAREITAVSYGSEGGLIEVAKDRKSLWYTPPADFAGQESLQYFVDGVSFATVQVDVRSPLSVDNYQLPPTGVWQTLSVLDNDPFWSGYEGPRRITSLSVTDGEGEVRLGPDGRSVEYRSGETSGDEQFIYIVDGKYPAQVTISVPPTLADDQYEFVQNVSAQTLRVQANDPFWKGAYNGARRITHVGPSSVGSTVRVSADGLAVEYTPASNQSGYDSFEYVIDGRYTARVGVHLARPVADDYAEVDINSTAHALNVLGNDRYWSVLQGRMMDAVTRVTQVSPASEKGGSVTLGATGEVLYTPPVGYSGSDRFTYTADGLHEASVNVQVTRPVRDDYLLAYQDTSDTLLSVLDNDFVGNGYQGARSITSVGATQQGGVVRIDGSWLRYSPPAGFVGSDSFTYTVDGQLQASVAVQVQSLANADWFSFCANEGRAYTLDVLNNDFFRRGYTGPGRITGLLDVPADAGISIQADGGSLRYVPTSDVPVSFRYVVDGKYEASVTTSVQQHLQGDQWVVDQNSTGSVIDPRANDFQVPGGWVGACSSSGYLGKRLITSVGASEKGGQVSVTEDGRGVRYAPPADFHGVDQFTYTVDGFLRATVSVQVVRRVSDDRFRVAPGASEKLPVLVNDLFGKDYRGAQKITGVTASQAGAEVRVGPDGQSLLYRAAAGFTGTDKLVYTVDGQLKAEVQVEVRADESPLHPKFASLSAYQEFLLADALERYASRFGQPSGQFWWGMENGMFDTAAPSADTQRNHSETNVQVAGVDEGDIVEFDSDYIYTLTGGQLVIVRAWPGEQAAVVSRTPIEGELLAEFLKGDRLTVISRMADITEVPALPGIDTPVVRAEGEDISAVTAIAPLDILPGGRLPFLPWTPPEYKTIVTVLDVSDRANPKLVQKTVLEGNFVESRAIGDFVYVALSNQATPPEPLVIRDPMPEDAKDKPWLWPAGVYETKDQYVARVQADLGRFVDDTLPNYVSYGADGAIARAGLVHEPEDVYQPLSDEAGAIVSLVSLNIAGNEPGLAGTSGVYTSGASQVYASLEHFYVFEQAQEAEAGAVTRILQFDWNRETGVAQFAASGQVTGTMLNQFSADELNGHLRIATTVSHRGAGTWGGSTENDLFVLREDGGLLEPVGALKNLAVGETTRSVRFLGDKAFLVTFRNVDPLFALDLADPEAPRVLGHLTLPGFSSYVQVIDPTHLLTVGKNTPAGAWGPTQVSLFDVSNLARPRLVDEYTFERFSQSESETDHHAFGYFARHGLLAIPTTRSYVQRRDEDGDGYAEKREWLTEYELQVLSVDATAAPGSNLGLARVGEVTHDSPVRRSGYIGDYLYSVAEDSIHAMKVDQPGVPVATVADLRPDGAPTPVDPPEIQPFQAFVSAAAGDLNARLGKSSGYAVPVATESSATGLMTVLRAGDTYYRYQSVATGAVLAEADFRFTESVAAWQNPHLAADVNNDGQISPGDALRVIQAILAGGSRPLDGDQVVRQIGGDQAVVTEFWDVNGDRELSPRDVLAVVNQFNSLGGPQVDTGTLDPATSDPLDPSGVDQLFEEVGSTAGDANLDGEFNSADLVLVFQRGRYEDGKIGQAVWQDGDWDGDRAFRSADLVLAMASGLYDKPRQRKA
jgi:hypothetical protein